MFHYFVPNSLSIFLSLNVCVHFISNMISKVKSRNLGSFWFAIFNFGFSYNKMHWIYKRLIWKIVLTYKIENDFFSIFQSFLFIFSSSNVVNAISHHLPFFKYILKTQNSKFYFQIKWTLSVSHNRMEEAVVYSTCINMYMKLYDTPTLNMGLVLVTFVPIHCF